MTTEEMMARIAELEAAMMVFAQYASDTWVREQAEEMLINDPA
jgi:hypothetical protein